MSATGWGNIFKMPELRRRLLTTVALLGIYRVGVFVPVPGTDPAALGSFLTQDGGRNTLLGLYDTFSGGALEQFSVFTLGIMPYISSSIIMQLLGVVLPSVERLQKEGESGKRQLTQWTRYLTIGIAIAQGIMISLGLQGMQGTNGQPVVIAPSIPLFVSLAVVTLTAGTAFLMWLGEQITERGIGNGISLIIFAGIIARMPQAAMRTVQMVQQEEFNLLFLLLLTVGMLMVVAFIVFCERAQRRIPVQYAKRVVGRRVYGGQNTWLPLKINSAGVIPAIFASALLVFPATIVSFAPDVAFLQQVQDALRPGNMLYVTVFSALVIFFCYFYTAVSFNPEDVAENMRKNGGYIPGIRPGKQTAEYIDRILSRITVGGALYLVGVCLLPTILISQFRVQFSFGGTSLLIVVGVALDTVSQIESHLLTQHYDGMLRTGGGRQRRTR